MTIARSHKAIRHCIVFGCACTFVALSALALNAHAQSPSNAPHTVQEGLGPEQSFPPSHLPFFLPPKQDKQPALAFSQAIDLLTPWNSTPLPLHRSK